MPSQKSRNWVFTDFDIEGRDLAKIRIVGAKYFIFQKELSATGRLHLQGACIFANALRLSGVRIALPGAHWEIMQGTPEEAIHYCKKPVTGCVCKHCVKARVAGGFIEGPWSFGLEPVGKGKRTDLTNLKRKLDEGISEREIAQDDDLFGTWTRTYRAIGRYKMLSDPNRTEITTAIVLWGPPGTGKTTRADELAGPDAFWLPKPTSRGTLWWDGFDGTESVVIDEFYGWISRDTFQRLVDSKPWQVETKGGIRKFRAKQVIVTSNQDTRDWWPNVGLGSMERRLAEPYGRVEYMGNEKYPTAESWLASPEYSSHGRDTPHS